MGGVLYHRANSTSGGENLFVIFLAGAYFEETFSQPKLLEKIDRFAKEGFCYKVLYLVDPIDKFPNVEKWFPWFDLVAGSAYEDEERHGIRFIDTPCVKLNMSKHDNLQSDIYVRLQDNGRTEILKAVYSSLMEKGVDCEFHVQTNKTYYNDGINWTDKRIDYRQMVEEELTSNVMLEIISPGIGAGATLRYKEAIMYNKKLLTNNPTVMKLPCFDPNNIRYFKTPEDIDVDWIKNREKILYSYNGEFSTDTFCEKVKDIATATNTSTDAKD